MGGVFISYRREDVAYALLVYHRLIEEFGPEQVFRDIEGIAPGENFAAQIDEQIPHSQAMVAVIGKGWIQLRPSLSKSGDFVRRELLLALEKRVAVFPVLVAGTQMPSRAELPRSLQEFALLNAIPVTDYRFDSDLDTVVQALQPKLGPAPPAAADGEATDSLMDKVDQLQIQAVQLIDQGDVAAAQQALSEGWELLMGLRLRAPGPSFDVRFGFVCKTLAQAFDAADDPEQADYYMGLAASAFTRVERRGAAGAIPTDDLAGAMNGLGNAHSYRGESDEAIACYRRALAILPRYAYAWHDLFLEYLELANRGRFELGAMRQALSGLKRTGLHVPGIGLERITLFERELARLEHAQAPQASHQRPGTKPRRSRSGPD